MAAVNPFRTRHSEATTRERGVFTSTFAPEILHVVPPPPFDQFYVVRSAPGAGKTSMMKCLTFEILLDVHRDRLRLAHLADFLTDFGVINDDGPLVLGVLENLDHDYGGLVDLTDDEALQAKLLFRLIDSRVMQAVVRAAASSEVDGRSADFTRVTFEPLTDRARRGLERLGGTTGDALWRTAETAENALLDLYDQVVDFDEAAPSGHSSLYCLPVLSESEILVDGKKLDTRPLIMLDDAHVLAPTQREALLNQLRNRTMTVGRWLAFRSVALADDDLMGAGDRGRDFDIIEIEALARERTSSGTAATKLTGQQLTHQRYRKMLLDIADRRATPTLMRILSDGRTFAELLDSDDGQRELDRAYRSAADTVRQRVISRVGTAGRYSDWLQIQAGIDPRDLLARASELEVLVERDMRRTQGELFDDFPLPGAELGTRGSSSLREAALLRTSLEFELPYYYGTECLARLGSANIEQFLELSGDNMARLLTQDATGRTLSLTPSVQDRIVREASRNYYEAIRSLPEGDQITRFIDAVAGIAADEASKPTIPYPPGVTGTALSMPDREVLKNASSGNVPAALRLHAALRSAIAHNVVWIELGYRVKNQSWMVIYLNRLLCPTFNLPLGLGGFRERKLGVMVGWMASDSMRRQIEDETLI